VTGGTEMENRIYLEWPNSKHNFTLPVLKLNRKGSTEYKQAFQLIDPIVQDHNSKLKPGEPQLNYCDRAVMVCYDNVTYYYFTSCRIGLLPDVIN